MANLEVAKTIVAQIGNMAFTMMGAKNLMGDEKGLTFRVGRNPKSVTHVIVKLEPDDTYTVKTVRVRGHKLTELAELEMVYCDNLRNVIGDMTGLAVQL